MKIDWKLKKGSTKEILRPNKGLTLEKNENSAKNL